MTDTEIEMKTIVIKHQ